MSNPVHVGDDDFEANVLNSDRPVLVDFWAEWCGPCKIIAPALEEIASDMEGKIKVAKMNVDENPHTPVKYNVRGIPMLIVFKDGQVAATKLGTMPKSQLVQWLESVI